MNCANVLYLVVVLCVLVSPSLTAPANENGPTPAVAKENKDVAQNEIDSDLHSPKKDAESIEPVQNQPSPDAPKVPEFMGGSHGTIVKIGIDGPCKYLEDLFSDFTQ